MSNDEASRRLADQSQPQCRTATQMRDQGEAQMPENTCAMRPNSGHLLRGMAENMRTTAEELDALAKVADLIGEGPAEQALYALLQGGSIRTFPIR